jgi:parallel beta-helix repeat protein
MPKERTYEEDYVEVVRNEAPTDITFDNIKLVADTEDDILYLHSGTNNVRFINSEISGRSNAVPIYFDAETTENVFKNNHIDVNTNDAAWWCRAAFCDDSREVMSIDSSSNNTISNNYFSGLNNGGIYLYRNCGEKGTTRHTTPSGNTIVNNIFYYNKYTGDKPAIYIASRNGKSRKGNSDQCREDDGSEYGSGVSDYDHAQDNIVMQNQIVKRTTKDMIKVKNEEVNSPNYIGYNTTVSSETVDITRKAGCFVKNGEERNFINHLDKVTTYELSNTTDFKKRNLTCRDGVLYPPGITGSYEAGSYKVRKKSFNCRIESDNNGKECEVYCDGSQEVIGGVHAACNLENSNSIVESELDRIAINRIVVLKQSGNFTEGTCYVGTNELRNGNTLSGNYRDITAIHGKRSVNVGCQEHDRNGGDCQIRGNLYCIKYVPPVFH